jgi:hypothetical protein
MAQAATDTAKLLTELAKLKDAIFAPLDITTSWLVKFINATQKYIDLIVAGDPSGFLKSPKVRAGRKFTGGQDSVQVGLLAKSEREAAAALKKRLALEKAAAAAKKLEEKRKAILAKGNALFDLEAIGLQAALKMSIDKETRLRLELLQAIQLGDADKIIAKMKELYDFQQTSDIAKLARSKTISEAQVTSINQILLSELDAIAKLKVSEEEKTRLQGLAFTKYNDAIKYAGGLAALSTYSQKLQDQELMIQRIANIYKISAAQTAADNIKQAALQLYLKTVGTGSGGTVAGGTVAGGTVITKKIPVKKLEKVSQADTATLLAEGDQGLAVLMEWWESAAAAANAAADLLDYENALAEMDYQKKFGSNSTGGTVLNFNAPITTTSTDEFARLVQKAIQNEKRFGNNLDYAGGI